MKIKKIIFAASGLAVGSGLLGTVLTSCSCTKGNIDSKLKIDLNDDGLFINHKDLAKLGFKDAIKDALTRSSNWTQFKTCLANEIVYRWYEDRAAAKQDSSEKNTTFRINLDEWNKQINKDWENTVKTVKNKYGKDYQFYLQNEYLSPNGGTEASYKRAKLVEKVRTEFISKVFQTNYFGYKEADPKGDDRAKYPQIYTKANSNISKETLNNPESWKKLGFFAGTNPSFQPNWDNTDVTPNFLAKNVDGDYATIQNYVFDRWFKTEKPFFSAAALFKYSNPTSVKALTDIYDETKVKIGTDKEAGKASETFPFFGGSEVTAGHTGTRAYKSFLDNLTESGFETKYTKEDKSEASNGTITIDKSDSEDSQTLLLCFGNKIHAGSSDTLVIPYANAAASLYMQMYGVAGNYKPLTENRTQQDIAKLMFKEKDGEEIVIHDLNYDNMSILGNFFFTGDKDAPAPTGTLDLQKVYGTIDDGTYYHCPLFKENNTFTEFYGKAGSASGIKFISNAFQADLGKTADGKRLSDPTDTQPWIFELNTYGMHVQTIDGYKVVKNPTAYFKDTTTATEAAKNVLKYRLMQKKCFNEDWISASVFGDSGKLKSYFNDNFTDIILEMAMSTHVATNIFRKIDTFKTPSAGVSELFLNKLNEDHKFSSDVKNLTNFIEATNTYDAKKKILDAYIATNTKIQEYRSKQIENSKIEVKYRKTIYSNGLLAPTPYTVGSGSYDSGKIKNNVYDIAKINLINFNSDGTVSIDTTNKTTLNNLLWTDADGIAKTAEDLYKNVTVNSDNAFSPQVAAAKKETSNRYWYKSYIVDKMMYPYMSNKEGMANAIKINSIAQYQKKIIENDTLREKIESDTSLNHALVATYAENKLFANNKNYSNYGAKTHTTEGEFYNALAAGYSQFIEDAIRENGTYSAEIYNQAAFRAALVYLMGDPTKDTAWTNFYKALNSKISEDEMAFTGYVSKLYTDVAGTTLMKTATTDLSKTYADGNQFAWTADVNNIFDNTYQAETGTARTTSDQYWHVINKRVGESTGTDEANLAGFTGLQTKTNNQLDSTSKLQSAAFDGFAEATEGSAVLSKADIDSTFKTDGKYADNFGCWFAFAGSKDANGKPYTFDDVTWDGNTIKASDFTIDEAQGKYYPSLKLAKKITKCRTPDDLRTLATKLGSLFYGDNEFRKIGDGSYVINDIKELKWRMVNQLPRNDKTGTAYNEQCFLRKTDVELHTPGVDKAHYKYVFDDKKGNGYKLILTQINKADVTEKTLTPKWDTTNNKFVSNTNNPLELSEFFYILCSLANESSIQQLAITDVVKQVYGDEKLVVYDAQLYNQFDTTWIKDWSKKKIGA